MPVAKVFDAFSLVDEAECGVVAGEARPNAIPRPTRPRGATRVTPPNGSSHGPVLLVTAPPALEVEHRYVLGVVLGEWLGIDYALVPTEGTDVMIQLVGDPTGRTLSFPDVLLTSPSASWLTERSMPAPPLPRLDAQLGGADAPIPVLFGESAPDGRAWAESAEGIRIHIDLLGGIFFLLTRYEELVRDTRDRHDRFSTSASIAAVEGFLTRPLADDYAELLWVALRSVWPALERRASAFRLRPTHDVDLPWAGLAHRAIAGDFLRRRNATLAARRVRSVIDLRGDRTDRDPFNVFDFLMETSERHDLRATFYFRAGGAGGDRHAMYRLSDPPVAQLLRRIHDRGHEVGLHASYDGYRSPEQTRAEFDELKSACERVGFEQQAWGVRQHYLRLSIPQTWRNHESAGIEHDSTLGFADHVGFRAGTCREIPLFDLLARRTLGLRERPLILMDVTMFEYMDLGFDQAASLARSLVRMCRRYRGDAVLLYHNDSLWDARRRNHYRELIDDVVRDE